MSGRDKTRQIQARSRSAAGDESRILELIGETPLQFRIDGRPYAETMRTPGEEVAHAAGFCFAEGIVAEPDDIVDVAYDEAASPNVVDVHLRPARRERIGERLERRFTVRAAGGEAGDEAGDDAIVADLCRDLTPVEAPFAIGLARAFGCFDTLERSQQHYQTTRGSHAALLFDERLAEIAFSEDVGRHNALDKAVGRVFLAGTLATARLLVLSSRISCELVLKAARARLPVMISGSRPTSLAVAMGEALNLTLAYPDSETELIVVCGEERITD